MNENNKNNSPNRWTDGELNDRHENNSPKGWTVQKYLTQGLDSTKITRLRDGWHKNNSPKGWRIKW